uniref:Uncharacterized protein n=1 Tax=Amphimedon queenslandica TaxID=400682 RepID=A0A1X7T3G5_AMPQE
GILTWMRDVRDNMRLTGYCEVQANRMWRDHAANNDEWGQSYHFARAAQCVMRFALLRAVGLEGHCPSDSKSVENNREALEIVTEQDRANINGDGLLVNNQPEPVRLFYSYFDSLFATHFIMAKLRNLGAGQNDDITRQMIIYNRRNN